MDDQGYKAAELLDEILRRADPFEMACRDLRGFQRSLLKCEFTFTPSGKVKALYRFAVADVMKGSTADPNAIVELLETGLGPEDQVGIGEYEGEPHFHLLQVRQDPGLLDMMKGVWQEKMNRYLDELRRQWEEQKGTNSPREQELRAILDDADSDDDDGI